MCKNVSIYLMVFFFYSSNALAERCTDWAPSSSVPAAMKMCEYDSGGSGHAMVKNTGYTTARICYKLFNGGKKVQSGCNTLAPDDSTNFSCFSCAERNGGVDTWSATYETK